MLSEFEIIRRYFTRPTFHTVLGVGDDCALIRVAPGAELAVSTDMLVSGCHFHADVDPEKLGHKALAVNLSDMAAMGANPRWATLSLALPTADETWLTGFSRGFSGSRSATKSISWAGTRRAARSRSACRSWARYRRGTH